MLDSSNMKLLDLNIGEIGVIKDIFVNTPEKSRLWELGFIPGEVIEVIFKSQNNSRKKWLLLGTVIAIGVVFQNIQRA